jgi:AraC-like DNA-binding protein
LGRSRVSSERANVSFEEIAQLVGCAGTSHTFVRPDLSETESAIQGRFLLRRLKSGILLHATDVIDLHDFTSQMTVGPSLTILLVLDGAVDFSVDHRKFQLNGPNDCRSRPSCSALMLTEEAVFARRCYKGCRTRKVALSIDGDWLDDLIEGRAGKNLRAFAGMNFAHTSWEATPLLLALAEQILAPPTLSPLLLEMYLECRSIELLAELLSHLGGEAPNFPVTGLSKRDTVKARTARDYIEANIDNALTLSMIARESGVSLTLLQRLFKEAYGATVVDYIRQRKLELARGALERDGVSISEAAFRAGYSSPANFSTAFRRAFGVRPSDVRR